MMNNFIAAAVIIFLALVLMAVGLFITGRSKLRPGACGRDPTKKQNDECENTCQLCEKPEQSKPETSTLNKK